MAKSIRWLNFMNGHHRNYFTLLSFLMSHQLLIKEINKGPNVGIDLISNNFHHNYRMETFLASEC